MTEVKCFCCEQKKFFQELPWAIAKMREDIEQNEDDRQHAEEAVMQCVRDNKKRLDEIIDESTVRLDTHQEQLGHIDSRVTVLATALKQQVDDRVRSERAIVQDAHAAERRIDALEDQLKKLITVQPDKPDKKKYDSFAANVATGPDEELRLRDENNELRKFVAAIARDQSSDFATDYIGEWPYGADTGEVYVTGARKLLTRLDWEKS